MAHALPVPANRQTDFTPKRVVVSRLHDIVARFRTEVKFSPQDNNRGNSPRGDSHEIALKYALKLIFLKRLFEFMINTAPPASNSVYGSEKLF